MAVNRESRLKTARNLVVKAMKADPSPRDLASLSRELRFLEAELEEIAKATPDDDALDQLIKEGNDKPSSNPPSSSSISLD